MTMRLASAYRRPILAIIAAAWTVSLALPAVSAGGRTFDGLELLLRGWEGFSRGVPAWIANPLFFAALAAAFARRDVPAAVLAALAVALGATSFMTEELLRRGTAFVPPIELRTGFYVWFAALLALCLHALTNALHTRRARAVDGRCRSSAPSGTSRD